MDDSVPDFAVKLAELEPAEMETDTGTVSAAEPLASEMV